MDKAKELIQKRLEKVIAKTNQGFKTFGIDNNSLVDASTATSKQTNQNEMDLSLESSIIASSSSPPPPPLSHQQTSKDKKKAKKTLDLTLVEENDVLYR